MHGTTIEGAAGMERWAEHFIASLVSNKAEATVVALSGDLGAGKTTLAQGIARSLGIKEIVISPTFVIEKIYHLRDQLWSRLVHIDAYRLKDEHELHAIGWDELIADRSNFIIVEWSENIHAALPPHTTHLLLSGHGDSRTITQKSRE